MNKIFEIFSKELTQDPPIPICWNWIWYTDDPREKKKKETS